MKNKNVIFYIVGGLIVVGGAIGAYFLLRKPKEDKEDLADEKSGGRYVGGGQSVVSSGIKKPAELNTVDKIKDFQKWVFYTKNDKSLITSKVTDGVDGLYGSRTNDAWNKYKDEYLKKETESSSTSSIAPKKEDVDTIINNAMGEKASRSYLNKTNPTFVSDWAKAIRNKRTAFSWANQVYSVKRGGRILEFDPLNKTVYATKKGQFLKAEAKNNASGNYVNQGQELGKVTAFFLGDEGILFLYIPKKPSGNNSAYKWAYSSAVSTTKPSSSFDGADGYEFSSLGNTLDLNI
jgi:hypothetical protein